MAEEANDQHQIAIILNALGVERLLVGDYDRAKDSLSQAATICQRLGNRIIGAYTSGNQGFVAMKQGNYSCAFELLSETILILQDMGDKEDAIWCLEPIAFIAKEQRFPEKTARLLGASESLRKEIDVIRSQPRQTDYDKYLAETRNQLGEAIFEAAWVEGCAMSYEQAIAYAVDKSSKRSGA